MKILVKTVLVSWLIAAVAAVILVSKMRHPRTIGGACKLITQDAGQFGTMYYWLDGTGRVPDGICADMYAVMDGQWAVDLPRAKESTLSLMFPSQRAAVEWVNKQPYKVRHTR